MLSSCLTVLAGSIVFRTFPVLSFTVTVPSSATSTFAPSGNVLFPSPSLLASSTAFLTAAFSSSVNAFEFATSTGVFGSFISVSSAFLTVCAGVNVAFLPSFVIVTLPLLSTVIVASAKSGLAAITAALIFSCSGPVTFSGSATSTGVGALTPSLFASCATVLSGVNLPISLPVLSLTVTVPSSATSIVAPSGNVLLPSPSLFASSTAFLTLSLSSSVNAFELSTVTGVFGTLMPASSGVVSSFSIVSSGPSFPVFVISLLSTVSFTVTVTLPLSSTWIWLSVNVGLTAFTASLIFACSSVVTFCGSWTLTGLGLFNDNLFSSFTTVSFWDRVPFLSPSVTVTEPSSATLIFAVSGSFGLASLTAFLTASFSAAINWSGFCTGVFSGATNLMILSVSFACSTVSVPGIVPTLLSPIGTVTVPFASTWISSSVNPNSGFAACIASFTACFSASVSLLVSPTFTFSAGGFSFLPSLVNGFTVSSDFKVPVLLPSLTVTLPLLSTVIVAVSGNEFFSLTAAATLSLSGWVKFLGSFTSVFSGAVKSSIVSFCTTVFSAGIVPILPPWLILTVPSASTVISSSLKFLSGLASFTACLTCFISSSVNAFAFSTLTGSFGGLKLFWTSFCFTVLSGVNVPVLPSFVTVTVPSSATVTSASVIPLSLFASATAFLTLSISSDVKDLVSFTSTGVGSFKVKGSFSVFSQTAYTVFGAVTSFRILASASFASFVAAQPKNLYPTLVGSAGFVTFPPSTFTEVVSLPSPNLPSFASKVTATSSE